MKISKRETQRLARRAQIVAVARRHFFEQGFDGTVMSAIAAELGGSKRTLWSYFPSKEALFAAVIEDTTASIRGGIEPATTGGTPYETMVRLCRAVIEQMTAPISLQMNRLISPIAERRPEIAQMFYERGPRRTQNLIGGLLRDHFGGLLWTENYVEAGKDLVALAAADTYFEAMWRTGSPPSAKVKDARARRAALLFIRAYGRDPQALLPPEGILELA
jgi:TetR/AcrR family transcriptional regulator, mexJK operon transcriptional repressor